ncbi:MAG: tRNA uridine-5-carboxymethylaminomethyl(34) synthesis GTPase MnmE [Firmicutes bacterium]|nr:tRNA uridine-5-carboxymethylaminomethyl(34) synthesis GTPase MnmE [Bacillota bacterium]
MSLVRVSGPEALQVVGRVFRRADGLPLSEGQGRRVYFGWLMDRPGGERLDECLCWFMPAPRSFTGEDVAEVSCHGGRVASRLALEAILRAGARLAEPGEFTRRAFLNGRVDLAQAEATIDLVRARTEGAFAAAQKRLAGELSIRVREVGDRLVGLLAEVEARADFPELELEELDGSLVTAELEACAGVLEGLVAGAARGRLLRDGLRVVLLGRPNVGKSSLLNALLGTERAIVSSVPGTTRDAIEESLDVDGVPVVLVDTAGVRETGDELELAGVTRTEAALREAGLAVLVVDAAQGWNEGDSAAARRAAGLPLVVAANKRDLRPWVPAKENWGGLPGVRAVVGVSARTGEGLEELRAGMVAVMEAALRRRGEDALVASVRQRDALERSLSAIRLAQEAVRAGVSLDLASVDLRAAQLALQEVTGEAAPEAVLDEIFSRFCIGK